MSTFALDYRCTDHGDWAVLEGHVAYCRDHGHATYTRDGETARHCPRCGEITATDDAPTVNVDGVTVALVAGLIRQGGATVRANAMGETDGVMVGRPGLGLILEDAGELDAVHVRRWVRSAAARMTDRDRFGIWGDEATGRVYLDVSERFDTLADALRAAHDRHELAVFDIATGTEYRVADHTRGLHY